MGNPADYIEVKSYGDIFPKKGTNSRTPYEHQKMAMQALDKMNQEAAFSTLVVIPTGGGKTYTASMWLLKMLLIRKRRFYGLLTVRCFWIRQQSLFRNLLTQRLFLMCHRSASALFPVPPPMIVPLIFVRMTIC